MDQVPLASPQPGPAFNRPPLLRAVNDPNHRASQGEARKRASDGESNENDTSSVVAEAVPSIHANGLPPSYLWGNGMRTEASFVEFRDRKKCVACQSRGRDCIMKPGTDACLLCADAERSCIFERTMLVKGPANKFAWSSLIDERALLELGQDTSPGSEIPTYGSAASLGNQNNLNSPGLKQHSVESDDLPHDSDYQPNEWSRARKNNRASRSNLLRASPKIVKRPTSTSTGHANTGRREVGACSDCRAKKKRCFHALNREKPKLPTDSPHATNPLHPTSSSANNDTLCPYCRITLPSSSLLQKHIHSSHTRPFTCPFRRYGCPSSFGSKNEWKRHASSQHISPGIYRCDMGACIVRPAIAPGSAGDNDKEDKKTFPLDFNRKDLFTQHLRRMHGPGSSASRLEKDAFDTTLEAIRARCWISLRDPPPKSICPYCAPHPSRAPSASTDDNTPLTMVNDARVEFSGRGSWDERMEHVGRHLEKGDPGTEVEDLALREWMYKEGLISLHRGKWTVVGVGTRRPQRGSKEVEDDSGAEDD